MAPPKKTPPPLVFAPPPAAPPSKKDTRKRLGVPENYVSPPFDPGVDTPGRYVRRSPVFFEGDELVPASFAPEKIAQLQREMATAGLIGPKTKFRVGMWDEATRNAYKNLLEYANVAGLDERTALKRFGESQLLDPSGEGDGPARAPLTIKKSNPADLVAVADVAARSVLGRKLRPEEAARLAAQFQGLEAGEQTRDYNQAETGGTNVAAPDARTFMADRIAKEYGVEAGAHDLAGQFGEFGKLLNQVGG